MLDLLNVPRKDLNQIFSLMQQEFKQRGWQAVIPYIGSPQCFITRDDGKQIHIFSATPPTTSFAAAHLANDKFATHQVLAETAIPQLDTIFVNSEQVDEAKILGMLKLHSRLVVKPKDGGHGKGITINCTTLEDVKSAIAVAQGHNLSDHRVLIQEQYLASDIKDIRIVCIDYKYVAALERKPAYVIGDGVQTVGQLIKQENTNGVRGKAYHAELAVIDAQKAEEYLGEAFDSIPAEGEEVIVLGIANYGAGGETIDITDDIPVWLREQAELASRVCELPVSGVDYMLAEAPTESAKIESLRPMLIEINKCPALAMHDMPTRGKPRNVVAQYCDYLARL